MEIMGIVEEWSRSILAENTRQHHQRSLRFFSEFIGASPEDILKARKERNDKYFETRTIEFFKWLQDKRGVSSNSARSYVIGVQSFFSYYNVPLQLKRRLPSLHMRLDEDRVTIEHLREMYKFNDLAVKTWISLSRDTPARIGDLLELKRNQIRPEFMIESKKEKVIGKIFLSDETINLFHKLWNIVPESEYAFSTPSGQQYDQTSINKMLRTSAKKAGLNIGIHQHSFRKLWITTAINLGLQTEVIKILSFKAVNPSFLTYFLDRDDLRDSWKRVVDVLSLDSMADGRVTRVEEELQRMKEALTSVEKENVTLKARIDNLQSNTVNLEDRLDKIGDFAAHTVEYGSYTEGERETL